MDAGTVFKYLRGLDLPVLGISLLSSDRATWRVDYEPDATAEQRVATVAAIAAYDPESAEVRDAMLEAAAQQTAADLSIAAFYRFYLYDTRGQDYVITEKDITDGRAIFARCFKEAAST